MTITNITGEFLKDFKAAIKKNIFSDFTDMTLVRPINNLDDFQIIKNSQQRKNRIEAPYLRKKPDQDNRDSSNNSKRGIRAFYLEYKDGEEFPGGQASITLDHRNAKYFFNAAMTGCRLIIQNNNTTLIHIDGGTNTDIQMNAICNVPANGVNFKQDRYIQSAPGELVLVFGHYVKRGWIFKTRNWEFYEQRHIFDEHTRKMNLTISRV